MSESDRLTLDANSQALQTAQDWLSNRVAQHELPKRTAFALKLCLEEALANTLKHGFSPEAKANARISLHIWQTPGFVTLEITDNGQPFDPTARTPRPLDASLETAVLGGHGLRLMRHYLHHMDYEYHQGHNRLRLTATLA